MILLSRRHDVPVDRSLVVIHERLGAFAHSRCVESVLGGCHGPVKDHTLIMFLLFLLVIDIVPVVIHTLVKVHSQVPVVLDPSRAIPF